MTHHYTEAEIKAFMSEVREKMQGAIMDPDTGEYIQIDETVALRVLQAREIAQELSEKYGRIIGVNSDEVLKEMGRRGFLTPEPAETSFAEWDRERG